MDNKFPTQYSDNLNIFEHMKPETREDYNKKTEDQNELKTNWETLAPIRVPNKALFHFSSFLRPTSRDYFSFFPCNN